MTLTADQADKFRELNRLIVAARKADFPDAALSEDDTLEQTLTKLKVAVDKQAADELVKREG